jgi:hypothetical protein
MAMQFRIWAMVFGSWPPKIVSGLFWNRSSCGRRLTDLGREIGCLAGVPRGAGGVAEVAPCRHSTRTSRLRHTRIGIYPGGEAHIAGHDLQRIGTACWILGG